MTIDYAVSNRSRLSLTLPFSFGTHSRYYTDGERHKVSAGGLGDVNLILTSFVHEPMQSSKGNLEIGIGVKAPTGKNDAQDDYFIPAGTVRFTVDQSIQLGDGGWGVILQALGTRQVGSKAYLYAGGSYLISPRNQTDVRQAPFGRFAEVRVSVPDVYQAQLGLSYLTSQARGVSLSLGGRLDGIPLRDLIGASDGFRRPVMIAYIEPGVSYARGAGTISMNIPYRVWADFQPSLIDRELGLYGGGDLAKTLLFVGYTHRF